jgi:hypothetical protein
MAGIVTVVGMTAGIAVAVITMMTINFKLV